jgi:hypothetical protein
MGDYFADDMECHGGIRCFAELKYFHHRSMLVQSSEVIASNFG